MDYDASVVLTGRDHIPNEPPDNDSAPVLAGDPHDDDGEVLESLFEEESYPPSDKDLPKQANRVTIDIPPSIGRAMTLAGKLDPTWPGAVQLLPANPRRKSLRLQCVTSTATDYFLYADDANKVLVQTGQTSLIAAKVYPVAGGHHDLPGWTGPLWVSAAGASALVEYIVTSIEE